VPPRKAWTKDEIEAELAEDEGADERYEQHKAKALAERHRH